MILSTQKPDTLLEHVGKAKDANFSEIPIMSVFLAIFESSVLIFLDLYIYMS